MNEATRRRFIQTTVAMAVVPFVGTEFRQVGLDELFMNCSPCRQLLTVEIAGILAAATAFDFSPRLVGHNEGRRFAKSLRQRFGRIQDAAELLIGGSACDSDRLALDWLTGDSSAQRIGWLEAFARAGRFRIQHSATFSLIEFACS